MYSATLGLVDIVRGTNSYYKLQLLEDDVQKRSVGENLLSLCHLINVVFLTGNLDEARCPKYVAISLSCCNITCIIPVKSTLTKSLKRQSAILDG